LTTQTKTGHEHEASIRYLSGTRHAEGYLCSGREEVKCWCGEVIREGQTPPPSEDESVIIATLPVTAGGTQDIGECHICGSPADIAVYQGLRCPDCYEDEADYECERIVENSRKRLTAMEAI